jgi:O-antigen ligase
MIGSAALDRADRTTLVAAAVVAVGVGVLAAATSPLVPAAALLGMLTLALIWWRPIVGMWLFVAVIAMLPFGVIPVPLAGAQLSFVDAVMIATFVAVLARVVLGDARLTLDAPAIGVVAFVLVAIAAFLAGSSLSPLSPELIRRTGKLLASSLFFLIARSLLSTPDRLEHLARWLIYAGAIQGALGAGLMVLSPPTQLTLLTRLQSIGYPIADVLRYVPGANNTYTSQLRAIGTSVDPNVFGGTLMLALALIVVQWASPRPVLRKSVLLLLAIPTAAGVLLSLSRASWAGLAMGLLLVGVLRYRRILVLALLVGLGVLASPAGQALIERFVSGFSTTDPATAFRVGEYGNALTLLSRYPLLGIGFGASPDIDVTAGVSSVYLLVAEQTGLVGLGVYVVTLAVTWYRGVRHLGRSSDARLQGVRAGFLAAMSGALVTGTLDHYFANQAFPHAVALFWLYAAGLVAASELSGVTLRQREPERAAVPRPGAVGAHRSAV